MCQLHSLLSTISTLSKMEISLATPACHQVACGFPPSIECHIGHSWWPLTETQIIFTLCASVPILRCSYFSPELPCQQSPYFVIYNTMTSVDYFLIYFFCSKDTTRYIFLKSQDRMKQNLIFLLPSLFFIHRHDLYMCLLSGS